MAMYTGATPWLLLALVLVVASGVAILLEWTIATLYQPSSPAERDAWAFIHASRTTKSGKGRCRTSESAKQKLEALRAQQLERPLNRRQMTSVQSAVAVGLEPGGKFAGCTYVYVSGNGIAGLWSTIQAACPDAVILRAE